MTRYPSDRIPPDDKIAYTTQRTRPKVGELLDQIKEALANGSLSRDYDVLVRIGENTYYADFSYVDKNDIVIELIDD